RRRAPRPGAIEDRPVGGSQADTDRAWRRLFHCERRALVNVKSIHFRMTAWYAGLLVCLLVLFGASVYLGLRSYLERTLRAALSEQARAVGEEIGERVTEKRLPTIVNYLNEQFAPQLNARFILVMDGRHLVLYLSKCTSAGLLVPALVTI